MQRIARDSNGKVVAMENKRKRLYFPLLFVAKK